MRNIAPSPIPSARAASRATLGGFFYFYGFSGFYAFGRGSA
jgi:hypothetical protein